MRKNGFRNYYTSTYKITFPNESLDTSKKAINVGMALFTGLFVGIIFLSEYLIPNISLVISVIIVGLSTLVGGLIGNKLFQNKS